MTEFIQRDASCTIGTPPAGQASPSDLGRRLVGLWLPAQRNTGRILRNLTRRPWHVVHGGAWAATAGGTAIIDYVAASFGAPVLPVTGAPLPFSLFARVIPAVATASGVCRQYISAQADRMVLTVAASLKITYSHNGDLLCATPSPIGQVLSIGISEQPGKPIRVFRNGILDGTGANSSGCCSATPTLLDSQGSIYLLALAIWVGRCLSPTDHQTLHRSFNRLMTPDDILPAGIRITPPTPTEEPYHRKIDMPNRPWWRRWSHRKIGY